MSPPVRTLAPARPASRLRGLRRSRRGGSASATGGRGARETRSPRSATDYPDATSHDDVLAWVEVQTQARGLARRSRGYREDPRCLERPADAAELERRYLAVSPDAVASVRVVERGPSGWACEVDLGDEVVRLFADDEGQHHEVRQRWPRTRELPRCGR